MLVTSICHRNQIGVMFKVDDPKANMNGPVKVKWPVQESTLMTKDPPFK